ncbi:MAG: hypothetical protein ACQKBU_05490 [Verrucomicrobiales bacterium]
MMEGAMEVDDDWPGSWRMSGFTSGDWPMLIDLGGWSGGGGAPTPQALLSSSRKRMAGRAW